MNTDSCSYRVQMLHIDDQFTLPAACHACYLHFSNEETEALGSRVTPAIHSANKPQLWDGNPAPVFFPQLHAASERMKPASGPTSAWVTLAKSFPLSEPQVSHL